MQSSLERVAFRGDTAAYPYPYWSFGVSLSQTEAVKVNALLVQGASSSTGVGINLTSSTIISITSSTFYNLGVGVLYNSNTSAVTVSNSSFGSNVGIQANGGESGLGPLNVLGNHFLCIYAGIVALSPISNVNVSSNEFVIGSSGGLAVYLSASFGFEIVGNSLYCGIPSNSATGVLINNTTGGGGTISANAFSGVSLGVWLASSSAFTNVQSNNYTYVTTQVINSAPGMGNRVGGGSD